MKESSNNTRITLPLNYLLHLFIIFIFYKYVLNFKSYRVPMYSKIEQSLRTPCPDYNVQCLFTCSFYILSRGLRTQGTTAVHIAIFLGNACQL